MSTDAPKNPSSPRPQKVASLLAEHDGAERIQEKYEEIYTQSDEWLYAKSQGVHSIVYALIAERLRGRSLLDVGCGAGRLAIMSAHEADRVTAFDFSGAAIAIAELNATCAGRQISFEVADIHGFCERSDETFDVVTMLGVLEHVEDPVRSLRDISSVMRDGGTLVVSCPNFINPRGFTYMTLLTLFDLPMSLADLRQVDYLDVRDWARQSGYAVEQVVGALYRFAWDDKAVADMRKRVPLAIRDARLDLDPDYDRYGAWLRRVAEPMSDTLASLEARGVLQRIERPIELSFERNVAVGDELWARMTDYMDEDIEADPFFSVEPPFCYLGGEAIYVLQKLPV